MPSENPLSLWVGGVSELTNGGLNSSQKEKKTKKPNPYQYQQGLAGEEKQGR